MGRNKTDYTLMAKEMAAAKEIMQQYYQGKINMYRAEIDYAKRTGKHRCFATIKRYAEGEHNGD
jgi:hypothetical protein